MTTVNLQHNQPQYDQTIVRAELSIRIPNHNQTVVRPRPFIILGDPGLATNHNQTLMRPVVGINPNHNQTLVRR
jgi:hypothetical protein